MSRFAEPQHPAFRAIHFSIDFDRRLWPQDLRGSRAHVRMLAACDVIAEAERDEILRGLDLVEAELAGGTSRSSPTTRTSTWPSSGA